MVLPISLLRTAQNHPMLVELKNGETYNGHLANCDNWMNVHLRDAICTSRDGDRFWKIPEVYIRGSTIKYLRIPDEILEQVRDDMREVRKAAKDNMRMRKQLHTQHKPGGGSGGGGGGGGKKPRPLQAK